MTRPRPFEHIFMKKRIDLLNARDRIRRIANPAAGSRTTPLAPCDAKVIEDMLTELLDWREFIYSAMEMKALLERTKLGPNDSDSYRVSCINDEWERMLSVLNHICELNDFKDKL